MSAAPALSPSPAWRIAADAACFDAAVEELVARAFGPGRFAKAAHKVREGAQLVRALSHVALDDAGAVIGACRLWQTGSSTGGAALLLGPIAVDPAWRGLGIGQTLTQACTAAADRDGAPSLVLVGDPHFFAESGFVPVPRGALSLPWPAEPARTLWRPAAGHALPTGILL